MVLKQNLEKVTAGRDVIVQSHAPSAGRSTRRHRFQAKPLANFVRRKTLTACEQRIEALASAAREGTRRPASKLVLHGPGGFGKSFLARALGLSARVRACFPDGVLWTSLEREGTDADFAAAVIDSLRHWAGVDDDIAVVDKKRLAPLLARYLADARILWIIDDLWDEKELEAFDEIPHPSMLLVTTRLRMPGLGRAKIVPVGPMSESESLELLSGGVGAEAASGLRVIGERLNYWPLLLAFYRVQLLRWSSHGLDMPAAVRRIEKSLAGEVTSAEDSHDRFDAIDYALAASLRMLGKDDERAFLQLAVLRRSNEIPLPMLCALWDRTYAQVEHLCIRLRECSLIMDLDLHARTFSVHSVFLAYLRFLRGEKLQADHRAFLSRLLPETGDWVDLRKGDGYSWRFLLEHLDAAGRREEVFRLLSDFRFLKRRLRLLGVRSLLEDFARVPQDRVDLVDIRRAVRRSAHVLESRAGQFASQMVGRIGIEHQSLRTFRSEALHSSEGLLPLRPSLARVGPLRETFRGHDAGINQVLLLSDAQTLISASRDHTVRAWHASTGRQLGTFLGHRDFVNGIAEIDGRRFVTAGEDGDLLVWDLDRRQVVARLRGPGAGSLAVVSLGSENVAAAYRDARIRIWNVETRELVSTLEGPEGPVVALAHLGSGMFASAGADGLIRIWSRAERQAVTLLAGHEDWVVDLLAFDNSRLVSASEDRTVRMWDLETATESMVLKGHSLAVYAVARLGSNTLVSASKDSTLRVWDTERGETVRIFRTNHIPVRTLTRLSSTTIASGDLDRSIRIWELTDESEATTVRSPAGILALASGTRQAWAAGLDDHSLSVWSSWRDAKSRSIAGHDGVVLDVCFVDEETVASASSDRTIRLWNLQDGTQRQRLEGHEAEIFSIARIDRKTLVSGSYDHTVRLWDLDNGQAIRTLAGHSYGVHVVKRLDRRHFASASRDKTIVVWDTSRGEALIRLEGHSAGVMDLAVLDEQERLISASRDGTLRCWDLVSGDTLAILAEHRAPVHAVVPLPAGFLASASDDCSVRIWDLAAARTVACFFSDWPIRALAFLSPAVLIAGDLAGGIHEFDLSRFWSGARDRTGAHQERK